MDSNQPSIVESLRKSGCSVCHLHQLGSGVGDILVGYKGRNYMFEIKDPSLSPSKRKLTEDEEKFHANWKGQIHKIETVEEILRIIKWK